jgi:hypothetical protein
MVRVFKRSLWAVFGAAVALAGCSPGPLIDRLPSDLGLPAGAPARPVAPYDYPAVHDMPPDRPSTPMTEEEQVKLEKDLARARDQQEGRLPQVKPPAKKPAPAAKKPSKDDENGQTAGAKPNP